MTSQIFYIHKLPYAVVRDLGQLLDPGDVWAELGGKNSMSLSVATVHELLHKYKTTGASPTEALITMWGAKNYTVNDLYFLLLKIQHHQAMGLIKPYVDPKYHYLHSEGDRLRYPVESMLIPVPERPQQGVSNILVQQNRLRQPPSYSPLPKVNNNRDITYFDIPNGANAHAKQFVSKELNVGKNVSGRLLSRSQCSTCNTFEACRCSPSEPPQEPSGPPLPVEHDSDITRPSNSPSIEQTDPSLSASDSAIQLSFSDIVTCTENFKQSNIVGKGGFGTVYKGILRSNLVAVKVIKKKDIPGSPTDQEAKLQHSFDELRALNRYRHENILVLHGSSFQQDCLCLVYQYMVNGSLEDRLLCKNGTEPLSWSQRCNILRGTACGLQYLHTITTTQFIHGDIKSANILLDSQLQAKIGDFGLAREGPRSQKSYTVVHTLKGTQAYLPHEYLRSNQLSVKVDVYSFGVVVYEVGTGRRAYQVNKPLSDLKLLVDLVKSWPDDKLDRLIDPKARPEHCHIYRKLMALGTKCTEESKKQRPDMEEVHLTLIQHMENINEDSKQSEISTAAVSAASTAKPPVSAEHKRAPPDVTAGSCSLCEDTPPPSYQVVFPPSSQKGSSGQSAEPGTTPEESTSGSSTSTVPPLPTEVRIRLPNIDDLFIIERPSAAGKQGSLGI